MEVITSELVATVLRQQCRELPEYHLVYLMDLRCSLRCTCYGNIAERICAVVLAYAYTRGENFDVRLPRVRVHEGDCFCGGMYFLGI